MTGFLHRIDHLTGKILRAIAIAAFILLFAILIGNVVSRFFSLFSMSWFDEIVELLFAWLVFLGAAAMWRDHDHFRVDWLDDKITSPPFRMLLNAALVLISLSFLVLMTWYGLQLVLRSQALTPIIGFPVKFMYASIPIAGFIMCLYSLRDLRNCLFTHRKSFSHAPAEDL